MKSDSIKQLSSESLDEPVSGQSATWLLVVKALFGLLAFDLLNLDNNFGKLHRYVSKWPVSPRGTNDVNEICKAIAYAGVLYPKRLRCLQRSAVMTCLLRSHGVRARMVMGAQSLPFRAHAWTEVDGHAVNERRNVQKIYRVLESC